MNRQVAWSPVEGLGLELAHIRYDQTQITLEGEILVVNQDKPLAAHYTIQCAPDWTIKTVALEMRQAGNAQTNKSITLTRSDSGQWKNHKNIPMPVFNGFTDVDITLTPMTNTLPIRRLNLQVGEAREIKVVYFEAPSLAPKPTHQRYTCLEKREDGGVYRFEALDTGFTADLPVDADGLVLDYPELFKRVWGR